MSPRRGFTLVELGVALAVAALLAATLLPDLVEGARVKAAERAALDISYIHDAARWYHSQTGAYTSGATGLIPNTWPGQPSSNNCTLPPGTDPFPLLIQNGFLAVRQANPWGMPYDISLTSSSGPNGCMLYVMTEVPVEAGPTLEALLPAARCKAGAGCDAATTPGFVRCCSGVTRPGMALAPLAGAGSCAPPNVLSFGPGGMTCGPP